MADGYGTIFRMRIKPGAEQQVLSLMEEWERDRKPKIRGALGSYLFRPDNRPNELIGVAVFRDQQSYRANGNDPEQDAWYRRLAGPLESDPQGGGGGVLGRVWRGGGLA